MSDGFFVADLADRIEAGDVVALTGREAHHAAVVRRLRPGETVALTDGRGRGVSGEVVSADPAAVVVAVASVLAEPLARPRITVVQALPKNDRAKLAVDLMTEVGVDRLVPWQAARSVVRWSGERGEAGRTAWETVARESSKQARRLRFPEVAPLASTAEVVRLLERGGLALVMHEREVVPLTACPLAGAPECVIVIGPEGGLTEDEVDRFRRAGAATYSLGSTVLRASTAGAVAIVQVRALALAQASREAR